MYVFLSHSSIDADVANGLCQELEKNGIGCFLAPRDIRSGHEYAEEIIYGIDRSDAMILVLSNNSNQSPHVLREVERAVSKNIPIIVYRIEDVILTKSMEYFLMSHQWLNGKDEDYQDMVNAVRNLSQRQITQENIDNNKIDRNNKNNKSHLVLLLIAAVIAGVIFSLGCVYFTVKNLLNDNDSNKDTGTVETVITATEEYNPDENETVAGADKDETKAEADKKPKQVELGDTVKFGSYNGVPIYWRVLKLSEDKTEAVLVTSNIITMKAFDAADSESFNKHNGEYYYTNQESEADRNLEFQADIRGNSDWAGSDIRAWLNATTELVDYGEGIPSKDKMSDNKNGYDIEPGFLTNFSESELEAIKTTVLETKGNALSKQPTITTEDKVYLLSLEDLKLFEKADMNILTKPTEECLEQDKSQWYEGEAEAYGIEMYCWWLREPVEGYSSKCYMVGTEYYDEKIWEKEVGLEGFGIRPAITVDLTSDAIVIE